MKVLFLGLGGIGQRHLRNLLSLHADAEVAAIRHTDRRFEITPNLAADENVDIVSKYGIAIYRSIDDAMDFKPDFAVVATPSNSHAALTAELVRRHVPVFLEKPAAHDRDSLTTLADLVTRSDVPVMVAYPLRFHPAVRRLRELVRESAAGQLLSVHIVDNTFMPGWHPYEDYRELYAARRALGGGVVLTNIHLIDMMAWILGRPVRLWCSGGKLSSFEVDVEDCVSALFEYRLEGRNLPVTLNLSFVQRPVEASMTFRGEEGRIYWNLQQNSVSVQDPDGKSEEFKVSDFEWNRMFVDELAHFIASLKAGTPPEASFSNTIDGQEIAFAMKDSLARGALVEI